MADWIWLGEPDALAIHGRVLALHGGGTGLRDKSLLQAALARPRQWAAYAEGADIADIATPMRPA